MEVMSPNNHSSLVSSTLNPNAPMFVPAAYRSVEDFSDEWWALVQSSPWFRDYWLQECFSDPQNDAPFSDILDLVIPDIDALFADPLPDQEEEKGGKDLVTLGALKWRKSRVAAEAPRYCQKAPKIVNVKVSPRQIQQPRYTESDYRVKSSS